LAQLGPIGEQNYGLSFANAQVALRYFVNKGLLGQQEFDRAVLKLVEAGYTFTLIDEGQFYDVILDEQFQITPRLKRVLRVLESGSINLPSACSATAGPPSVFIWRQSQKK
jgi:hypothetical protein